MPLASSICISRLGPKSLPIEREGRPQSPTTIGVLLAKLRTEFKCFECRERMFFDLARDSQAVPNSSPWLGAQQDAHKYRVLRTFAAVGEADSWNSLHHVYPDKSYHGVVSSVWYSSKENERRTSTDPKSFSCFNHNRVVNRPPGHTVFWGIILR